MESDSAEAFPKDKTKIQLRFYLAFPLRFSSALLIGRLLWRSDPMWQPDVITRETQKKRELKKQDTLGNYIEGIQCPLRFSSHKTQWTPDNRHNGNTLGTPFPEIRFRHV